MVPMILWPLCPYGPSHMAPGRLLEKDPLSLPVPVVPGRLLEKDPLSLPVPVVPRRLLEKVLDDHDELREPLDRFHHQPEQSKPEKFVIRLHPSILLFPQKFSKISHYISMLISLIE